MWVQFWMACPLKFGMAKNVQNPAHFWQLSTLIGNIYGTDPQIENWKGSWSTTSLQPLLRWAKKSWWTLIHKQKSYWRAYWPTQVDIVRETIFRPLRGDVPSNFCTRYKDCTTCKRTLELGRGPPQKNDDKNLKCGLKFSVCALITSGIVGIFSPDFSRHVMNFGPQTEKSYSAHIDPPELLDTVSWSRKSIRHVVLFGVIH